ncbi:hypothetical protein AB0M20_21260, partial [Actinoplanes sp. NPDC051633]
MTSEGQHAGGQPAEATSGGGPGGGDGFPPDSDSGREPSSYAPPPKATPNGGSPFVVPAVPQAGRPFAEPPANRYGIPTAEPQRPTGPESVWAPPPTAPSTSSGSDGDHPYHGFAAGSPTRGQAGAPEQPSERPPGVSAFGDQRVRVPGATLTDLPDGAQPSAPP